MKYARKSRFLSVAGLVLAGLLAVPARPSAHEIPANVRLLAFVRPEQRTLRVVLRLPLESIRDVDFKLRGDEFLELEGIEPLLRTAAKVWLVDYVTIYEGDRELTDPTIASARVSLPSDRSFESYEQAIAYLRGPLPEISDLPWRQAMVDLVIEYPIQSDQSAFSIEPAWAHLGVRTLTVLRFKPPDSGERVFQYYGHPGLVRLDPSWYQAALRFVKLGFFHILDGIDHLLFVLCLVIPFRKVRPLVAIITSFTVAHSITLIASAIGLAPDALWFPPLIEMLIALSIVYMAFENIVGAKLERRWLIAFGFGLVHGFGFSFALRDSLQFAGGHVITSLLSFNVGVELGQLAVLAVAVPALVLLFRYVVAERMGTIILSALIAHTAWHWMTARAGTLRRYRFEWPAFDSALMVGALRGLMLILILVGTVWLLYGLFGRLLGKTSTASKPTVNAKT